MGSPFATSSSSSSTNAQQGETHARRTAIIMVANEGVVDLLLNYLCSAEQSGIELGDIMVFVGSESDVQLVEGMGVHAMYAEALGAMPTRAGQWRPPTV